MIEQYVSVTTEIELGARTLNLTAYARKNRYRVRNLHDGDPVPPARRTRPKGDSPAAQAGFIGKEDRYDAIVGYDGYVTDEGNGQLGIYLTYGSAKGVNRAEARIRALGGTVVLARGSSGISEADFV